MDLAAVGFHVPAFDGLVLLVLTHPIPLDNLPGTTGEAPEVGHLEDVPVRPRHVPLVGVHRDHRVQQPALAAPHPLVGDQRERLRPGVVVPLRLAGDNRPPGQDTVGVVVLVRLRRFVPVEAGGAYPEAGCGLEARSLRS